MISGCMLEAFHRDILLPLKNNTDLECIHDFSVGKYNAMGDFRGCRTFETIKT
jgi:hypothetical protein